MRKVDLNINFGEYVKSDYFITSLIRHVSDKFDQQASAKDISARYFNDASSRYYHKSPEEIVEEWNTNTQKAISIGVALDEYVGLITEPMKQEISMAQWSKKVKFTTTPEIYKRVNAWEKYWENLDQQGWEMVAREVPLRMEINGRHVSGRADMIVYNKRLNNITIIDWKTADKIGRDRWTKPANGPFKNEMWQDKATIFGLQIAFYKMILKELLPDELKDVSIDTCIVQVCSNGEIIRTKNNIKLNDEELTKLLTWCISEEIKCNDTVDEQPQQKQTIQRADDVFIDDIAKLLRGHGWDKLCRTPEYVLAKFILNTLNNYKDTVKSV